MIPFFINFLRNQKLIGKEQAAKVTIKWRQKKLSIFVILNFFLCKAIMHQPMNQMFKCLLYLN